MPEGHSIHRIALQFRRNFVGQRVAASSPQGRFAAGAEELDGREILASSAVGKHLLLEFEGERTLHVHLGLYGAWDFAGQVTADPTFTSANGRMGQTNQRGTMVEDTTGLREGALEEAPAALLAVAEEGPAERNLKVDALPESSLASIGAPRLTRLRMSESEREVEPEEGEFPPPPIGQVRLRLLTETAVADLRGPTACEVFDPQQVEKLLAKLGPDPMHDSGKGAEDRFVARVRKSATPIGLQLMDQSVVAGIGNVYRAELLFRARLNPHAPGKSIPEAALRKLWKDWAHLLAVGVETGQMMTRDDLKTEEDYRRAMASRDERHYVYKRTGQKSPRGRGTVVMEDMGGRNLYWAPGWQTKPDA
ncbi:Fpg/Nei family DNA glycosylase [Amnibacterium setariae]|uniref:DNA-(apurinic or apyrimidinic site) lyase n=1 Tax=Amnibacterium setariae TaxID=2306585 RepID=A0A3A1U5P2_9MICO|nr:DNA-formamidopyrimidine glycosylase family protein [Amnibacterium setariae]RIX28254.1 Fpg/Nei family DNA glycosylase [Amnibacterium setariae]